MALSKGSHKSRWGADEQEARERAKNRVISELRVGLDKAFQQSDLERRRMENAVMELRRKVIY